MTRDYRELLLGCGHDRRKKINPRYYAEIGAGRWQDFGDFYNPLTLDYDPGCEPDIVLDLERYSDLWLRRISCRNPDADYWEAAGPHSIEDAVRLKSNYFDEVHAYEVLEHLGRQGDEYRFFQDFESYWRVLKPNGFFCATVPSRFSQWAWGDPGHKRLIPPCMLVFLDQEHYAKAVGHSTSSDYRRIYHADFRVVMSQDDRETHSFVLQAIKPSRGTP